MKNKFLITFTFIVMLSLFSSIGFSKTESNSFFNITIPDFYNNVSLNRFGDSPSIPLEVCNLDTQEAEIRYETILHRITGNSTEGSFNTTLKEKQITARTCWNNETLQDVTDAIYCGTITDYMTFNTTILSKTKKEHKKTNQTAGNCKTFILKFKTIPDTEGEYNITVFNQLNQSTTLDPFWGHLGNSSINWTDENFEFNNTDEDLRGFGLGDTFYVYSADGTVTNNTNLWWWNYTNGSQGVNNFIVHSTVDNGCFVPVNETVYMIHSTNAVNTSYWDRANNVVNDTLPKYPEGGTLTFYQCNYYDNGIWIVGGNYRNNISVFWLNNYTWSNKSNLKWDNGTNVRMTTFGTTIKGSMLINIGGMFSSPDGNYSNYLLGYETTNDTSIFLGKIDINVFDSRGNLLQINSSLKGGLSRTYGFKLNNSYFFSGSFGNAGNYINESFKILQNNSASLFSSNEIRLGFPRNGTNGIGIMGTITSKGKKIGVQIGGNSVGDVNDNYLDIYTFHTTEDLEAPSNNAPLILNISRMPNTAVYGGSYNFTSIYFDIDNTNASYVNFSFKFANNTIKETNMTLMYAINSSATNWSMPYLITLNTLNESLGIHKYWINASDGTDIVNSAITEMNITDFVKPDLTIINPTNSTYVNTTRTPFNYSAIDNVELSKVWWQFNKNGTNVTITDNFTMQFDSGSFLIEFWANDSSNNINYSNVSIQVNTQSITSTLVTPNNNTILTNSTITFNCSATTVNLEIKNITFYWSGENGTFMQNETISLTGTSNSTLFARNITQKNYKWNCLFWSNSTFSDFADSNNTIIGITNTTTLSISISPTEPKLMNNLTIIGTASSGANTNVSWVNFTLIAPNGTRILNHINSSLIWNSSINKLDKNGTWTYFANASNNYGKHADSEIGYITVSDIVSVNPNSYSRALNLKGENWTFVILSYHDTDETLSYNITFEDNLDPNHFNTSINSTNFILTSSNTQFNPFGILVQINTSANILNGTYNGNITIRRVYDNRLIRRISVTAGVNPPAGVPLLSDNQFRVCSVNSSCDSIAYYDNGPGATYQNFWKFNNTGGFNLSDCQMQIYDSSLNNDITSSTFAGFVLSPSNLVVEANNGSTISLYKSSLQVGSFYGRLDLNCTSDNFGHRTTLSSINSSQLPIINITVKNPSGGGGAGGSTAGGGQPSANVTLKKEGETCILTSDCSTGLICNNQTKTCERLILCGDGICDTKKGESSLTCPSDCKTFLTSSFWQSNPVIIGSSIIFISLIAYLTIKTARKRS